MGEKPETDDFDDEDDDAVLEGDDDDLDRGTRELEFTRRRGSKDATPAWRRLELRMEEKRTAELTSDFADYDLDEPLPASRGTHR